MTELETKTEAEMDDFTDELSDEALDREQGEGRLCPCMSGSQSDGLTSYGGAVPFA